MAKTTNLYVRLDPIVKEQAESVLSRLGVPMASAVSIFLQQVVLQNGLPFEVKLPAAKPIALGSLSEAEFDTLMERAYNQYKNGECVSAEEVGNEMNRKYGI